VIIFENFSFALFTPPLGDYQCPILVFWFLYGIEVRATMMGGRSIKESATVKGEEEEYLSWRRKGGRLIIH
jgi:hypothetical protein